MKWIVFPFYVCVIGIPLFIYYFTYTIGKIVNKQRIVWDRISESRFSNITLSTVSVISQELLVVKRFSMLTSVVLPQ